MKIKIENIGFVKIADVEINGITVIAGENNTGKSTIGKSLYSIFNSFYDVEHQIKKERIESIERILDYNIGYSNDKIRNAFVDTQEISEKLINEYLNFNDEKNLKLFLDGCKRIVILEDIMVSGKTIEGVIFLLRKIGYRGQIYFNILISNKTVLEKLQKKYKNVSFDSKIQMPGSPYTENTVICLHDLLHEKINGSSYYKHTSILKKCFNNENIESVLKGGVK